MTKMYLKKQKKNKQNTFINYEIKQKIISSICNYNVLSQYNIDRCLCKSNTNNNENKHYIS